MCGIYSYCTKSFLFVISLFFLLVGGALTGIGTYALVYELVYHKHFLDSFFEKATAPGFSQEQKERFTTYFTIVMGVSIGLGFFTFISGISGMVGACQNFKIIDRFGIRVSSFAL